MENQEEKGLFYYMRFHLGILDNLINLQVVQGVEICIPIERGEHGCYIYLRWHMVNRIVSWSCAFYKTSYCCMAHDNDLSPHFGGVISSIIDRLRRSIDYIVIYVIALEG